MSFKLLAVRPIKGCDRNILKSLNVDEFYFLDNTFEPTADFNYIKRKKNSYNTNDFYFSRNINSSLKSVKLTAIVGKNGEGKSTLTEIILMILNNFYFYILSNNISNSLTIIENLNCELYYEIGEEIYKIISRSKNTEILIEKNGVEIFDYKIVNDDIISIKPFPENFKENFIFFNLNINYSLYSFNSLKTNIKSNSKNIDNRVWFNKLFHKNDGYLTPIVIHPSRVNGNININREEYLTNQRVLNLVLSDRELGFNKVNENQEISSFLLKINNSNLKNKYEKVINYALDDNNFYESDRKIYINDDVKIYLQIRSKEIEKKLKLVNVKKEKVSIKNYLSSDHEVSFYDCFILKVGLYGTIINEILNERFYHNIFIEKEYTRYSRAYLEYKALSIILTNPKYLYYIKSDLYSETDTFDINSMRESMNILINMIFEDDSHVTLKFFQALNYLCNYRELEYFDDIQKLFFDDSDKSYNHKKSIDLYVKNFQKESSHNINKNRLILEYLPNYMFDIELVISNSDNGSSNFCDLSSGERQLINSTSSIIYHLKNIDSIIEDRNFILSKDVHRYKYINIILDEIELYFHPDYQRSYVNNLMKRLEFIKFKNIEAINIIFVTHSPFILSDFLKNDVLFLKNGKSSFPMDENTFGANIHTLLQHGFFLESTSIGDFSKKKINQYFKLLHEGKTVTEQGDDLFPYIVQIGEPFIKSQLFKMYHELNPQYRELEILKDKISNLEQIVSEIKNKSNV